MAWVGLATIESLFLSLSYIVLRHFSGGIHFSNNIKCLCTSILLFFILICLIIFIYSGFKLYTEMKNLDKENFVVDDPYFETRQTNQYCI